MKKIATILFVITSLCTQAQVVNLTGRVLYQKEDSVLAIPFASVSLQEENGHVLAGMLTDTDGNFIFPFKQLEKAHQLTIQSVGFEPLRLKMTKLPNLTTRNSLGDLILMESAQQLKEITVRAQKDEAEYDLDKKVFNVGDNPAYTGASAIDVLQNVPSMTVDLDGTISMRGSNKITVLIDGKPAGLSGSSRQSILEQIPASMIERIEVISNPSSRYDADGSGGVINIITKKNKFAGYNGSLSANVGTNDKYNVSASANLRIKKWNYYTNADWRDQLYDSEQTIERLSVSSSTSQKYLLSQRSEGYQRTRNQNIRLGTDWYITDKQTLSFSVNERGQQPFNFDSRYSITQNLTLLDAPSRLFTRTSERDFTVTGRDWVLGYQKNYADPKKKWTVDVTYSTNRGNDAFQFTQRDFITNFETPSLTNPRLEQSTNADNNTALTIQTDVDLSLGKAKKGRIEYGVKAIIRENDTDYSFFGYQYATQEYLRNVARSNHFIYNEKVLAGYLSLAHPYKKWNWQTGLRAEYTAISINQKTQQVQKDTSYLTLFPSFLIGRPLAKGHRIQASFSRRINRPAYTVLNPFVNYSDSLNLQTGNPYLKPELINAYEIGYSLQKKSGFSLNGTLFYRQTVNSVVRTRQLIGDNITLNTWLNLGSNNSYGLELVAVQPVTKWWKVNANWSIFKVDLVSQNSQGVFVRSQNSWTARLNSQFMLWKDGGIQLMANYRSSIVTPQGRLGEVYSVDVSFRKTILKKKATLTFRVSDLFNTQKFNSLTEGLGFSSSSYNNRETRVAFVGLTYRFNKKITTRLERRERKKINEERAGETEQH